MTPAIHDLFFEVVAFVDDVLNLNCVREPQNLADLPRCVAYTQVLGACRVTDSYWQMLSLDRICEVNILARHLFERWINSMLTLKPLDVLAEVHSKRLSCFIL
jgi:hypothetical protein